MADWYYIGHYGQLGPLTQEQMEELVQGGVIVRETYVWASGMASWVQADQAPDLRRGFHGGPALAPPPPPTSSFGSAPPITAPPISPARSSSLAPYGTESFSSYSGLSSVPSYSNYLNPVKSDRSRVAAGVLNILLPGIGRMYLGYAAVGVLQLFVTVCTFGIGWVWPIVDGILILSGSVKTDGYGRTLGE